jgi:hypothetical protein
MTSHLHRFCLLIAVAALLTVAFNAIGAPELGRYVGILRVRKTLPPYYTNALSVTTTIRVVAEVIQNHTNRTINILAAVAETPLADFDTEGSVIRGRFQSDGSCIIHGPSFGTSTGGPIDYLATVSEQSAGFTLRHDNIPLGVEFFADPHLSQPITDFEYRFRRVRH